MNNSFTLVYWIGLWSLSPPSTSVSSDFMVLCKCFFVLKLYLLHFTLLRTWSGGIGPLPGRLTNYCSSMLDTVGWVIWPVKIVPNMTYNVFGGTLNPTLLLVPTGTCHHWPPSEADWAFDNCCLDVIICTISFNIVFLTCLKLWCTLMCDFSLINAN